MNGWGHSFANVLTRPDISIDDRFYACKTLADMADSEDKWEIACDPVVVEAIATIMAHADKFYVNERHKAQLALAMTRCICKGGKDACMAYASNQSLTDSLCKLTRHQEPFLQMATMSAVCMLTRCDDAVGSNKRLLKAKWHNVLEAERRAAQGSGQQRNQRDPKSEDGRLEMQDSHRPFRTPSVPAEGPGHLPLHAPKEDTQQIPETTIVNHAVPDPLSLSIARTPVKGETSLYGSDRPSKDRNAGYMHDFMSRDDAATKSWHPVHSEDSWASSRATELAYEGGAERRSSISSVRSSQSSSVKDLHLHGHFQRSYNSPNQEPLKTRLNVNSLQRQFSPSSMMFRKEPTDPAPGDKGTALPLPDDYLGLAREVGGDEHLGQGAAV